MRKKVDPAVVMTARLRDLVASEDLPPMRQDKVLLREIECYADELLGEMQRLPASPKGDLEVDDLRLLRQRYLPVYQSVKSLDLLAARYAQIITRQWRARGSTATVDPRSVMHALLFVWEGMERYERLRTWLWRRSPHGKKRVGVYEEERSARRKRDPRWKADHAARMRARRAEGKDARKEPVPRERDSSPEVTEHEIASLLKKV